MLGDGKLQRLEAYALAVCDITLYLTLYGALTGAAQHASERPDEIARLV